MLKRLDVAGIMPAKITRTLWPRYRNSHSLNPIRIGKRIESPFQSSFDVWCRIETPEGITFRAYRTRNRNQFLSCFAILGRSWPRMARHFRRVGQATHNFQSSCKYHATNLNTLLPRRKNYFSELLSPQKHPPITITKPQTIPQGLPEAKLLIDTIAPIIIKTILVHYSFKIAQNFLIYTYLFKIGAKLLLFYIGQNKKQNCCSWLLFILAGANILI